MDLTEKFNQLEILESSFYAKRLLNTKNGCLYNVTKVLAERWDQSGDSGWWIKILVETGGSHALLFWQNINCTNSYVRKACALNQEQWQWVE